MALKLEQTMFVLIAEEDIAGAKRKTVATERYNGNDATEIIASKHYHESKMRVVRVFVETEAFRG